jgi:hypothetical protein
MLLITGLGFRFDSTCSDLRAPHRIYVSCGGGMGAFQNSHSLKPSMFRFLPGEQKQAFQPHLGAIHELNPTEATQNSA